jgi:hypothetical protein
MGLFDKGEARPFEKSGLTLDPVNPNKGTKRGVELLETSVERYGAGRSILATADDVVIAGNKTAEVCAEKGIPFRVVETDGRELIVVKRRDLKSSEPQAKELAIADNRTSEVGLEWDGIILDAYRVDGSVDLGAFFFDEEINRILGNNPPDDDNGGGGGAAGSEAMATCPKCGHEFKP